MQKKYDQHELSPKEKMELAMRNRSFGKTVVEALDNLPKTKTAILVKTSELYSSPKKWNFYEPLNDNKKMELIESIHSNGVLSPIIVWEVDFETIENEYDDEEADEYDLSGNKYLVLAGHNRVDAVNKLYEATKDEKYLSIPAFILKDKEINLNTAKEIVIDTNYVQRALSIKEIHLSIMHKYAEVEKDINKSGRTRDIVAKKMNISATKIEQYRRLSCLTKELKEMVYEGKIALNSMLKIADKSIEIQNWIYSEYKDVINNKILNKVKPYMKKSDIQKVFEKEMQDRVKTKKISVEVPEPLIDEFKDMAYQWIYNKTKRG